ncbi:MAG: hypothetical protein EWM72_00918 [Nitrospira sp.]|nr:MAG: hypothetical protein EWM72_00918 [Nitrospira sp.]
MSLVYRENQAIVAGIPSLEDSLEKPFDSRRVRNEWYDACEFPHTSGREEFMASAAQSARGGGPCDLFDER